jgi:hypothetical protein
MLTRNTLRLLVSYLISNNYISKYPSYTNTSAETKARAKQELSERVLTKQLLVRWSLHYLHGITAKKHQAKYWTMSVTLRFIFWYRTPLSSDYRKSCHETTQAKRRQEAKEKQVRNPFKMRHPVEELVGQLVATDLPSSRATLKLELMITSRSYRVFLSAGGWFPDMLPLCSVLIPLRNVARALFMSERLTFWWNRDNITLS